MVCLGLVMVGMDESTELWLHPLRHCYYIFMMVFLQYYGKTFLWSQFESSHSKSSSKTKFEAIPPQQRFQDVQKLTNFSLSFSLTISNWWDWLIAIQCLIDSLSLSWKSLKFVAASLRMVIDNKCLQVNCPSNDHGSLNIFLVLLYLGRSWLDSLPVTLSVTRLANFYSYRK